MPATTVDSSIPPSRLVVWLAIQLLAIALGAGQVRLWAGYRAPGEAYTLAELLAVQIIASSLLFPWLIQSMQNALMLAVASFPMIALAGVLSMAPLRATWFAAAHLLIWLAALGQWRKVGNGPTFQMLSIAFFSSLNIGGIVLMYLAAENGVTQRALFAIIPLVAAIQLLTSPSIACLLGVSVLLLGALIAAQVSRVKFST